MKRLSLLVLPILLVWLVSPVPLHAQSFTITDLGALPGNTATNAYGLNNLGQTVGTSDSHVGFIYSNGTLVDLNSLIPTNSGFIITDALGTNDPGQILCNATNSTGAKRAVMLTPK